MTGPKGNSEFYFSDDPQCSPNEAEGKIEFKGKQNSLFLVEPVIKCFLIPPSSKLAKTQKKSFALRRLAHKFVVVSGSMT